MGGRRPDRVTEKQLAQKPPPFAKKGSDTYEAGVPLTALTLHQPLASLMVAGLKRVEGRVWDSQFRGKLWIHAATKEISEEEIRETEARITRAAARYPSASYRVS